MIPSEDENRRHAMPSLQKNLDLLYKRNAGTIKLDLEPVRKLLEQLGHPEQRLHFIHVAGTNGKGSVCAMLASILTKAGFRTGFYTSPHLVRFNERIQIDGSPISDEDLAVLLEEVDSAAKKTGTRDVTFFEFTTAVAFNYFQQQKADIVVLETGLGGRLDATNVVMPLLSVITNIGIEHTAYLGNTLEQIAEEKAGIIKPGRPVVCGRMDAAALQVMTRVAKERAAPLVMAEELVNVQRKAQTLNGQRMKIETQDQSLPLLTLPLLGSHQLENCATAVATIELLRTMGLHIDDDAVIQGLETVSWPARFQVLSTEPVIILDGAHNPAAAKVLAKTFGELEKGCSLGMIVGFLDDKDCCGFMKAFKKVDQCWVVPIHNERAKPSEQIIQELSAMGIKAQMASLDDAMGQAKVWALEDGGAVCITGSLYLAGEVLTM